MPFTHHTCPVCQEKFKSKLLLRRHTAKFHPTPNICPMCEIPFKRPADLNMHMGRAHSRIGLFGCYLCDEVYNTLEEVESHYVTHKSTTEFELIASAYKGFTRLYRSTRPFADIEVFNASMITTPDTVGKIAAVMQNCLVEWPAWRASICFTGEYIKYYDDSDQLGVRDRTTFPNLTKMFRISRGMGDTISNEILDALMPTIYQFTEFVSKGSSWVLRSIPYIDIKMIKSKSLGTLG